MRKTMTRIAILAVCSLSVIFAAMPSTAGAYNCSPSANVPGWSGTAEVFTAWVDCSGAVQKVQFGAGQITSNSFWYVTPGIYTSSSPFYVIENNMTTVPGTMGQITTTYTIRWQTGHIAYCLPPGGIYGPYLSYMAGKFSFRAKNPLSPFNWGPWHPYTGPIAFSSC